MDADHPSWAKTFYGRPYSPAYGYGKLDVAELVKQTAAHELLGPQAYFVSRPDETRVNGANRYVCTYTIDAEHLERFNGFRVEHIDVAFNMQHRDPNLRLTLVSPNGVVSALVTPGQEKHPWGTLGDAMLTLAHWGEPIEGNWTMVVENADPKGLAPTLTFWGEKCRYGPCRPDLLVYVMLLTGILLVGALLFFVCRHFMKPVPPATEFLPAYSPPARPPPDACPPPPYAA